MQFRRPKIDHDASASTIVDGAPQRAGNTGRAREILPAEIPQNVRGS